MITGVAAVRNVESLTALGRNTYPKSYRLPRGHASKPEELAVSEEDLRPSFRVGYKSIALCVVEPFYFTTGRYGIRVAHAGVVRRVCDSRFGRRVGRLSGRRLRGFNRSFLVTFFTARPLFPDTILSFLVVNDNWGRGRP